MRIVRQENAMGCGIACAAMVAAIPYKEALLLFDNHTAGRGVNYAHVMTALRKLGFLSAIMYPHGLPFKLHAFADIHIVAFDVGTGFHYVVWFDGKFYDPNTCEITDSYRGELKHIIGVWFRKDNHVRN